MAVGQAMEMLAVSASSQASQLLQVYWALAEFASGLILCRSRLAGEGCGSGDGDVGCADLIAGKPAPTGLLGGQAWEMLAFAGKPASTAERMIDRVCTTTHPLVHFDDEPVPPQPRSWAALRQRTLRGRRFLPDLS
jgi:hypothetical protein